MSISDPEALGARLREARTAHGWSQAYLAELIGASRHWVMQMERGKSTVEMGLVLRAVLQLGLEVDLRPLEASGPIDVSAPSAAPVHPSGTVPYMPPVLVDLEQVLERARGDRLDLPTSLGTAP